MTYNNKESQNDKNRIAANIGEAIGDQLKIWTATACAIGLPMLVSMFVSNPWWITVMILAEAYAVYAYRKRVIAGIRSVRCSMMAWLLQNILFWSGLILLIINLLYAPWFFGDLISSSSTGVKPVLVSLVLLPTAVVLCLYVLTMGMTLRVCRKCQRKYGNYPGNSPEAMLYFRESRFQAKTLLWISLCLSIAVYIYYGYFYVNLNFNNADEYFFELLPVLAFAIAILYFYRRYAMLKDAYAIAYSGIGGAASSTILRYLVMSGDKLFLRRLDDGSWDTPFSEVIGRQERLSPSMALDEFKSLAGDKVSVDDVVIKYIYTNEGYANGGNVLHYAAFLPESVAEAAEPVGCMWFTADMIDRLIGGGQIAPLFGNELYRIYTVTMAWKTYDRKGKRLYPIKNYRPTFRLKDLRRWDVDYDDTHWLEVSGHNEDKPFYRVRNFWNNLTGNK